ncbi:hypothetical protein ACHAXA_007552 [Cyclostephanos tholiformis]|uniref:Uncharacterized protein n=1 Tax=Cyclostephanos tholiformis TaxID=382380 RepID=A0ABD3SR18_9STRA
MAYTAGAVLAQLESVVVDVSSSGSCPDRDYVDGVIYASDGDFNGVIDQIEYLYFADTLSDGYLSTMGWSSSFNDLPLSLRETYLVLSCLCEIYPGSSPEDVRGGCCTAGDADVGIRTDGTGPMTGDGDAVVDMYLGYPTAAPSISPSFPPPVVPPTPPTLSPSVVSETGTTASPTAIGTNSDVDGGGSYTNSPTSSSIVTTPPSVTPSPTSSTEPTTTLPPIDDVEVDVPVQFNFVASVMDDNITAMDVIDGENNQIKKMLEEELLELCEVVIGEAKFGTIATNSTEDTDELKMRSMRRTLRKAVVEQGMMGRMLVVEKCVSATVDDVGDVDCPSLSGNSTAETCLNFTNTIVLHVVNDTDPEGKAEVLKNDIVDKIANGWLAANFDLGEALKPPPTPSPTLLQESDNAARGLPAGAIIGIVVAAMLSCVFVAQALHWPKKTTEEDTSPGRDERKERQQVPTDIELARHGFEDQSFAVGDDLSSINTPDVSYSSQEHLLRGQYSSTADVTPMPALKEKGRSWDDESEMDDSLFSEGDHYQNVITTTSSLASMAAMSTLVASTSRSLSPASMEEYSPRKGFDSESTGMSDLPSFDAGSSITPTSAAAPTSTARAAGMASPVAASAEGTTGGAEGLGAGAAAAIGVAGAGVLAAGAYVATRQNSDRSSAEDVSPSNSKDSSASSSNDPIYDLDSAIEAGNWGQVGAIAAVLASKGHTSPPATRLTSRNADKSQDSSTYETSLDRMRASEIDKLVDIGDWQGVVLAAARFEADQTFDGESYSASASNSSRWTGGSGTSASANTRSIATGDYSTSNVRGQEEIRAEVEALVRRVVPEEADNINEMMTQFKGREEELVETLRRMQERAIASRARLAVQKSAKLEARIKKGPRGVGLSSGQSVASASSTKSELEQAIEAGNWQAVGAAAQKMSDSSVGDLSVGEVARLRDVISQSPAFASRGGGGAYEHHLDQLIEQGDWQGVIAAAKRATEGPDMGEQDALAQANMWQEIADQSKVEARQGPAGAGDAAAWAISRSLNALNTAEESSSHGRTIDDIADEQESDASQYESSSYGDSAGRSEEYRRGI